LDIAVSFLTCATAADGAPVGLAGVVTVFVVKFVEVVADEVGVDATVVASGVRAEVLVLVVPSSSNSTTTTALSTGLSVLAFLLGSVMAFVSKSASLADRLPNLEVLVLLEPVTALDEVAGEVEDAWVAAGIVVSVGESALSYLLGLRPRVARGPTGTASLFE
jgi:LytS/YehU family sensor histidine kinase